MPVQSTSTTHSESITIPSVDGLVHVSDAELVAGLRSIGAVQRMVDVALAAYAAEAKRRSHSSLGHRVLAARAGFSQAVEFVQSLTGASKAETSALITAGEVLAGAKPWLGGVARAVEAGDLSVAAGAAIANGLGSPSADVSADDLADVADALVQTADVATGTSPEQVSSDARRRRAELDVTSVADLEAHRFARRSMTRGKNADGMRWTHIVCDPESDAVIHDAIRTAVSPRRVEFRDAGESGEGSEGGGGSAPLLDTRTPAQKGFDGFFSVFKLGVSTKDDHIFGHNDAAVRVHVSAESLVTGDGTSWIECVDDIQPAATAQRLS